MQVEPDSSIYFLSAPQPPMHLLSGNAWLEHLQQEHNSIPADELRSSPFGLPVLKEGQEYQVVVCCRLPATHPTPSAATSNQAGSSAALQPRVLPSVTLASFVLSDK